MGDRYWRRFKENTFKKKMSIKIIKDYYLKDDTRYNRVTSVLDYFRPPSLFNWAIDIGKKEYKDRTKEAKKIGTRVDNLIKQYLLSKKVKLTESDDISVENCLKAYFRWKEDYSPMFLDQDKIVSDNELKIAGTYDLLIEPSTIVDIKCSNQISLNYWLQVAMYAKMAGAKNIAILRLDKMTADYEYVVKEFDEQYVSLFLGLLINYRYHNQKGESNGNNTDSNIAGKVEGSS